MRPPLPRHLLATALAVALPAAALVAVSSVQSAAEAQIRSFGPGSFTTPAYDAGADRPAHNFYFTRAIYSGRGRNWATDYPTADRWINMVLRRLTLIDAYPRENTVRLDDPELRRFPFIYALEVGGMALSQAEAEGLRNYLLAGGFLVIDDFWGTYEWYNFEREIRRVLPEYEIVEIPLEHEILSTFYQVEEIVQVPNITNGVRGGPTHESDGYVPHIRGIFDESGRLMVIINWNTDLGDAWEHAEDPRYPLRFSTYAYQMGANFMIYAMTH